MTATIFSLQSARQARQQEPEPIDTSEPPKTEGPMLCDRCGHRETFVVAPIGKKWFECPKCECMAMKRIGPVLPADGVTRQSCPDCRGQTFSVTRECLLCSDCGSHVSIDWGET